jgi:hypothetical protein
VRTVADWPVDGIAFTFYVPARQDRSEFAWSDLSERDLAVRKVLELKSRYPQIKANVGALKLMFSSVCRESTGDDGERCVMKNMLPLYIGENGRFERTFCCYGNDVDCSRCGAYAVFNGAYQRRCAAELNRS